MIYILWAAALLFLVGMFIGSVVLILNGWDAGSPGSIIAGVIGLILVLSIGFWVAGSADNKPCVQHATVMQYNAATKTTMPVRYCVQYGEWVR